MSVFLPCEDQQTQRGGDLRLVHAAVVEDEAGVGEGQARLLGLEVELHNLVVGCRERSHEHKHRPLVS